MYSHALDHITDVVIHAIAGSWEGEWCVKSASHSFRTLFGKEVGCTLSELASGDELYSAVSESRGSKSRATVLVGEKTVQVQVVDLSEMEGTPSLLLVCHDLTDFKVIPLHNTKQKTRQHQTNKSPPQKLLDQPPRKKPRHTETQKPGNNYLENQDTKQKPNYPRKTKTPENNSQKN